MRLSLPAVGAAMTALLVAVPASAASRSFPVGGFDRIRNTAPFTIKVRTGGPATVRIEGEDDFIQRATVSVERGELVVGLKSGSWRSWGRDRQPPTMFVTMPGLTGAAVDGPGNIDVDRAKATTFRGAVHGPGNLSVGALDAERVELAVSGPGNVTVAGRAGAGRVALSGPGNVNAGRFTVRDADVAVSGPGTLRLNATGAVRGAVSGPGNARITGGAQCAIRKSFPGEVNCG